ncbi:MAG: hypothetical protein HY900_00665 [Deltaproteobacteria bacterium]|nr:hypothetical protein [Deltaproteobacteria bacterium]
MRIDVLYMNHGPLRPVLEDMVRLFANYGAKIQVAWHDFESDEGERFKATRKIREHVPLRIWIDGRDSVEVRGARIEFNGFPSGSGPQGFQGRWRLANLQEALDERVRRN